MKALKIILIIIVVIIAVPLLLALFIKKEYTVERTTDINRPCSEVFAYIRQLKNHDKFSVWNMRDPKMKRDFRGTDGEVGFVSAWDSQEEQVGQGEQEIKRVNENALLETEVRFIRPWQGVADASMQTQSIGPEQTRVTWSFHSKMPYPMNIMLLFMNMNNVLGKDMQQGLDNLKRNLEVKEAVAVR